MGRRLFLHHLSQAALSPPSDIYQIRSPDEGLISFTYLCQRNQTHQDLVIKLVATDLEDYPENNEYILYTERDNVDPAILRTLQLLGPSLRGKLLIDALLTVSRGLRQANSRGHLDNPIEIDNDNEVQENEQDDDSDFDTLLEDAGSDDGMFGLTETRAQQNVKDTMDESTWQSFDASSSTSVRAMKQDLLATKRAGFRVGTFAPSSNGGITCVSIRLGRLGLSEEAMRAWDVSRKQYLVLMVRFLHGYHKANDHFQDEVSKGRIQMRVGLCNSYKPFVDDALAAFNQGITPPEEKSDLHIQTTAGSSAFLPFFISRPLNDLLHHRFPKIVHFREAYGFGWDGAENFYHDAQGKTDLESQNISTEHYDRSDDKRSRALPSLCTADAMQGKLLKDASLPLIAMQFVLRHFVRCTEFCLVCHCKIKDQFESLKPYVCARPLCLYQYMALGFGPSIEWELLSQPYVIDLLVSFCYAAAEQEQLKQFPTGLNLTVPVLPYYNRSLSKPSLQVEQTDATKVSKISSSNQASFKARLDQKQQPNLLKCSDISRLKDLKRGMWLAICLKNSAGWLHCQVQEVNRDLVTLGETVLVKARSIMSLPGGLSSTSGVITSSHKDHQKFWPPQDAKVDCYPYNQDFDTLSNIQKNHAILTLLDTMPDVLAMQKFVQAQHSGNIPILRSWSERISESALNLLRWIVASNRSCILQVDKLTGKEEIPKSSVQSDDRLGGMDEWMQFRFAQGAPDKEERFLECVTKEQARSRKKYATLFAWHGSSLSNWHSIVREGLRFDRVVNGRAYGDGVYMSSNANVSIGYTHGYRGVLPNGACGTPWPQSLLKISSAFSLNEVVNRPENFVSRNPYYVVNNTDWIQTRYLLVKAQPEHVVFEPCAIEYKQDPAALALNASNIPIYIPITAISKSRRRVELQTARLKGGKKSKTTSVTDQATAEGIEDGGNSVVSNDSDYDFLEGTAVSDSKKLPDGSIVTTHNVHGDHHDDKSTTVEVVKLKHTKFTAGTLDKSKIKILEPPADASPIATKALMQSFKQALKVQSTSSLQDLGWYIDPEAYENLYQWVVELHSFPLSLPLARDMEAAGLTSVVLEMRFTNQYPFAPPFIRVVQPRFLPFHQGGGGHVTDGGAICMELLTNTGWSVVSTIESVLLQVRMAISAEERPARLASESNRGSYGIGEAVAAYGRACRAHGWSIPPGFDKFDQ